MATQLPHTQHTLLTTFPDTAEDLFKKAEEDAQERLEIYRKKAQG